MNNITLSKNILHRLLLYITFYFVIISMLIHNNLEFFGKIIPIVESSFVFFFYIYKKNSLNIIYLFITLLTLDSFNNYTLGFHSLVYFLTILIFLTFQKILLFKNFTEIWLTYLTFLIIILFLKNTILLALVDQYHFDLLNIFFQIFLSFISYTVLHGIYNLVHKYLLKV
jgi:hypothetical protein